MALLISFWYDLLIIIIILSGVIYHFLTKNHDYWKKRGVPGPKPKLFFGNTKNLMTSKKSINEEFGDLYNETKHRPYVGVFMMRRPTLLVNDLDIIKNILITNFSHFTDRPLKINIKYDPIADHLFNATGTRWKNMRVKMTPTFSSSKMREMFNSVAECCQEMMTYLNEQGDDRIEDMKEILAKLNTDIIGTCAFGIECNTFKNPNSTFRQMGRRLFDLPWWRSMLRFMIMLAPKISYNTGISLFGKDANDFFYETVKEAIEYRKKNNVVRKDFLNILMGMLKDDYKSDDSMNDGNKLTLTQLSAQVFVFFIAGFETSSSTASFALYELAVNPDVQKRLRIEIDETLIKHNGKMTYDSLSEMKYLTQVIEETMRKYPVVPLLRLCTKEYIIPNTNVVIEKDTPVMIPAFGIHMNPDIYPNPEKFDPDRFSAECKASRHPMSYLPFGEGPRICIGNRFGLMQTRLSIAAILSHYEVCVCERTPIPMTFDPKAIVFSSKGGTWLRLKSRKNLNYQ